MSHLALVLALITTASPSLPRPLHDVEHGFSLVVPRGFVDFPEGRGAANVIHAFARGTPGAPDFTTLTIGLLPDALPRSPLDHDEFEREKRRGGHTYSRFDYRSLEWHDVILDETLSQLETPGGPVVVVGIWVPLAPHAIRIVVAASAKREAAVRAELHAIIASLDGRSTWPTTGERLLRLGLVSLLLAILLFVWWRRRSA